MDILHTIELSTKNSLFIEELKHLAKYEQDEVFVGMDYNSIGFWNLIIWDRKDNESLR